MRLYRKERINAGLLAYKYYCNEFGRPDIIHAHSRFLESIIIAKKIKEQFGIPYIITEHSTFHQRNMYAKYYIGMSNLVGYNTDDKLKITKARFSNENISEIYKDAFYKYSRYL